MKIPCRKCLLLGVSEEEVKQKTADYLSSLPEESRTPSEEYEKRLAVCEHCPELTNGLCKQCGCFVLYRAGILANHCPLSDRW